MGDLLFWSAFVLSAYKMEQIIAPIKWKPAGLLGLVAMAVLAGVYGTAIHIGMS